MEHRERIGRVYPRAGKLPAVRSGRSGLFEEEPAVSGIGRRGQLRDMIFDKPGVHAIRRELGPPQNVLEKFDVGRHAPDLELAQRAIGLRDRVGEIRRS